MTKDEALKLALAAMEGADEIDVDMQAAITAIKEALAQPEPVALEEKFSLLLWDYQELERAFEKVTGGKWVRKSNTPQRTWVGLTDEDMEFWTGELGQGELGRGVIRAVADHLKEKNT